LGGNSLHIYLSGYAKQMIDISRQVQAAYDQIVLTYADRNHGTMADNLIALAERLVRHTGRGAHIIDVGCGTGRDMAWFESHGLAVTGIDLSSGMLAYARRQVSGHLLAMHMCHLGFRHAQFDGAWSCAALLHVPKREASDALGEIRRVLKSGGMLIVSLQEGNGESWEEGYVPGIWRFFARYQADEMRRMLCSAGFSVNDMGSSHGNNRDWLSCVCIAQ
jgi:ubiquinone/menaquinone biosynthesis C-methylase UbiE